MNVLRGEVVELLNEGDIVIVKIRIKGRIFSVLMLGITSLSDLKIGKEVDLLFKEHELVFMSLTSKTSIENTFEAKISGLKKGKLLWNVEFDFEGLKLHSIITALRGEELGLCENDSWLCCIKANDITLRT
ncbi:MAG: molybdenum-pterin-binding protein [Campylobacter sp.]|nr:molybdenum-pterin-binding protein [Campylobacter sp.]